MASAIPARDTSATDRRWHCTECQRRHRPGTDCPPTAVWLITGKPAPTKEQR